MTPINLRLFCGPYYITCGNFATLYCAQRSPLDSSSIHVLWCGSRILTCFMTGFVLWPVETLPSPRPQRSMKILAFSKTLSVYEDPCLLQDPFDQWRSLPFPRPHRSMKIQIPCQRSFSYLVLQSTCQTALPLLLFQNTAWPDIHWYSLQSPNWFACLPKFLPFLPCINLHPIFLRPVYSQSYPFKKRTCSLFDKFIHIALFERILSNISHLTWAYSNFLVSHLPWGFT